MNLKAWTIRRKPTCFTTWESHQRRLSLLHFLREAELVIIWKVPSLHLMMHLAFKFGLAAQK